MATPLYTSVTGFQFPSVVKSSTQRFLSRDIFHVIIFLRSSLNRFYKSFYVIFHLGRGRFNNSNDLWIILIVTFLFFSSERYWFLSNENLYFSFRFELFCQRFFQYFKGFLFFFLRSSISSFNLSNSRFSFLFLSFHLHSLSHIYFPGPQSNLLYYPSLAFFLLPLYY